MNIWKNNGYKISFLLITLIFYISMCRKQSDEFNINDLSYLNDNCAYNCKTTNIDIMKCLDACAINNKMKTKINYQPIIFVIITFLLFIFYILFKSQLNQFYEYLEYRLYSNRKFISLRNDDYEDEEDSKQYYRITDI